MMLAQAEWNAFLKTHSDSVMNVAFSLDSRHVMSTVRDNTFKLWDVTSGNMYRRLIIRRLYEQFLLLEMAYSLSKIEDC